jgi:chemotaxis protein methyltransferase CheR
MPQPSAAQVDAGVRTDYVLSDQAFDRIRALVREHTGIALSDAKRQLVYGRLARRLRSLQLDGFDDYIELLEQGDPTELEQFTNAVTTNLTSFFREAHHFEHLAAVLGEHATRNAASRRLRLWCCAASTGEEPYSIAMVLREQQSLLSGYDVKLLATDIDSNVLATASEGIYGPDRLEAMTSARMSRFFHPSGARAGHHAVDRSLKELITFKRLNLMDEWPMRGPFDFIFCRNVIIYFDKPTQRELFARMALLQRPGDLLFLGHSESLYRVSDSYDLIGRTIYRRKES